MNCLIRTDASNLIGSGHVMRCLTLAQQLVKDHAANVEFICREHRANLIELIEQNGFSVHRLPARPVDGLNGYAQWLGASQTQDAKQCLEIARDTDPDWLIVDHYALDIGWEKTMRTACRNILVIDDLAQRAHDCDLLLDQNYLADQQRYDRLIPDHAVRLLGPEFALLRNEFSNQRPAQSQGLAAIEKLFIFFGGIDPYRLTLKTLKALQLAGLRHLALDVVITPACDDINEIKQSLQEFSNARLHVQAHNMAQLMSAADLAIGAGGASTWERLAIGLPSLVISVADNQIAYTRELDRDGFIRWLGVAQQMDSQHLANALVEAVNHPQWLQKMALKGLRLVAVDGASRVSQAMTQTLDKSDQSLRITLATDRGSWMMDSVRRLFRQLKNAGHHVALAHEASQIVAGDCCFLLSFSQIIDADTLARNQHNLVVHASALPAGRGMSPLSWQILQGSNTIPLTLFEAQTTLDSGDIYQQTTLRFKGDELIEEMRAQLAAQSIDLCRSFISNYPRSTQQKMPQQGNASYFARRTPDDSQLDPNMPIAEQFSLLRIVDNQRYPAWFDWRGQRYHLKIEKTDD